MLNGRPSLRKSVSLGQSPIEQPTLPPISITYLMLTGTGEGSSTGDQQATIMAPYQDQVRQAGLEARAKLEEGPTESPVVGTK